MAPTLVFLLGKSHGQRNLAGDRPLGRWVTKNQTWLSMHAKRMSSGTNVRKGNNNNNNKKSMSKWKKPWPWDIRLASQAGHRDRGYLHGIKVSRYSSSSPSSSSILHINSCLKYQENEIQLPNTGQLTETIQINRILLIDLHFVYKPQQWTQ